LYCCTEEQHSSDLSLSLYL